jgi:hypothetical protein
MKHAQDLIQELENKLLETLYHDVKIIFSNANIPSHDEDHHLRVWKYSLTIVHELQKQGYQISMNDLEKLMIAVFFHDTGLVSNPGTEHGRAGVEICKKWLGENNLSSRDSIEEIFYAIEHHDDKVYNHLPPLIMNERINLLGILGISDDLDAFGYTGIYRYLEIYLLRGISTEEIGSLILSNLYGRYRNFLEKCFQFSELVRIHSRRFEIANNFFKVYNKQLLDYAEGKKVNTGPYSIVQHLRNQLSRESISIEELCKKGMKDFSNKSERLFFRSLRHEFKNSEIKH